MDRQGILLFSSLLLRLSKSSSQQVGKGCMSQSWPYSIFNLLNECKKTRHHSSVYLNTSNATQDQRTDFK